MQIELYRDITELKAQNEALIEKAKKGNLLQELKDRSQEYGEEFKASFNNLISSAQDLESLNGKSMVDKDNLQYNKALQELEKCDGEAKKLVEEAVILINELKEFNKKLGDIKSNLEEGMKVGQETFISGAKFLFSQVAHHNLKEMLKLISRALAPQPSPSALELTTIQCISRLDGVLSNSTLVA